jgi:hypothetical protein
MPKLSIFPSFIFFLHIAHHNKATHKFLHFYHTPIFSYEITKISTFIEINKTLKIEKGPLGLKVVRLDKGKEREGECARERQRGGGLAPSEGRDSATWARDARRQQHARAAPWPTWPR